MDENHQDKTESKRTITEDKSQLLPLSRKEEEEAQKDEKRAQKELARLRKRLRKDRKKPKQLPIIVGISVAVVGVIALIIVRYLLQWAGWLFFLLIAIGILLGIWLLVLLIRAGYTAQGAGFKGKTLWDWLNLLGTLAIPIVVVLATIGFGLWQAHLADLQHEADKQSALDQQGATILQTYIDNIQDLLLNHNLLKSKPGDDIATLARARTLTALRTLTTLQGLDPLREGRPERKGFLVQFLYEANLIGGYNHTTKKLLSSIIDLSGAELFGANLVDANLSGANLSGAILESADLFGAKLYSADLTRADLNYVYLGRADLSGATLTDASMTEALLYGTRLTGTNLTGAYLYGIRLSDATVTQQQLDQVYSCKNAILPPGLTCHHDQ